ncbi:putative pre-mRNA-processing protein 40A-like isoform X2 [Capsicum annuum]|nr:putative pre-mRNA-processing protein 40A-like isoform X2 [Capsicum annuum]
MITSQSCSARETITIKRADASTDLREFTSLEGRKYFYNKVTRMSKWRMPNEVKLAHEKDTILHASDLGSIFVVKTLSPGADGSLVSAHGAKSSLISVSQAANLPTIMASESSSLSSKVSSPMIETVKIKNSSEPTSPAVANLEKIGIAVTLGNSVAPPNVKKDAAITEIGGATPSDEKTVELGPLVYENQAKAKSAFKTLLKSTNIGSDYTWDQAMRAVINDRRYGALKSLCERKQAFNEYLSQKKKLEAEERRVKQKKAREDFRIMLEDCKELSPSSRWSKVISILENDKRFKSVERAKDRDDLFEDYVEELDKKEYAKALEVQKHNRRGDRTSIVPLLLTSFVQASSQWQKVQDRLEIDERCSHLEKIDRLEIFQEYIRDLESEEEEQRKLRMIKDFAAYLAVSSNTSGSIVKDLFTDIMDELEKQVQVLSSRFDSDSSGTLSYILYCGESSCSEDVINMPPHRVRRNNDGQQPQPADPLNENVSHAKFRAAFQGDDLVTARIRDFMRMNPPEFYGSKSDEDPQLFLEEVWKITQVMHVSEEHSVELIVYRLKDLSYNWVISLRKGRGEGAIPIIWQEFQDAFLDKFFPLEMREANVEEFMNLGQGSMTIREYRLKFNQLAKYAPNLVADNRASMSKFVTGVSSYVVKECRSAMLNSDKNLSRLMTHA